MIGITITPSHIDYSKILDENTVNELVTGECVIISGFAKELSPVKLGMLKNSIMWKTSDKEGDFNKGGDKPAPDSARLSDPPENQGYVGSGLEYAGPVEFGRRDMPNYPRQPYLRPAIDYSANKRAARRKNIIGIAIKDAYHG